MLNPQSLIVPSGNERTTSALSNINLILTLKRNLPPLRMQLVESAEGIRRNRPSEGPHSPEKLGKLLLMPTPTNIIAEIN